MHVRKGIVHWRCEISTDRNPAVIAVEDEYGLVEYYELADDHNDFQVREVCSFCKAELNLPSEGPFMVTMLVNWRECRWCISYPEWHPYIPNLSVSICAWRESSRLDWEYLVYEIKGFFGYKKGSVDNDIPF